MRSNGEGAITIPHLRAWRQWLGYSAPELSARSGLSKQRLYQIEAGQPVWPASVGKLAVALGISRVALLHVAPDDEAGLQEWARGREREERGQSQRRRVAAVAS